MTRAGALAWVTCLVVLAVLCPTASADRRVGGVDFDARCRQLGYDHAALDGPVHGSYAAYNWRCVRGSTRASIDVDATCRAQYGRSDVYARPDDVDDAYSWRCWRRSPPPSVVTQLPPMQYKTFDGATETVVPWQGEKVTVLTESGTSRDPAVMTRLVSALDHAYRFYARMTGREPDRFDAFMLNGRDTIAQVPSTCSGAGAGCGHLGAMGIEVADPYFDELYDGVRDHDQYSQIPFYELGRNFFFYEGQLKFHEPAGEDTVVTGYAVWMRFESMTAAAVEDDQAGEDLRQQDIHLVDKYEADPSITFADTLDQNRSPAENSGTDFWASLMMRLAARYGGTTFIQRFWHTVAALPAATTTVGAVANWERAASRAACADLFDVFYTRWGFPLPDGASRRPPAATVPYPPRGRCRPADRKAPVISHVHFKPHRFRAGRHGRLRLHLSERATLRIAVQRRGRRHYHAFATVVKHGAGAGAFRRFIGPRVKGKRLQPGRYRIKLHAVDGAGNRSRVHRVRFRVLRAHGHG